ncbi:RDD family protein [uncultured Methanoregula sp.]|uniref:RDD family protein n=1 Tax=uncultured Methanoregula sp. TaxID=1005933 RepID=UPI002AAB7F56|nr:RDD family protein [uncultured Methanoregula sp.]
MFCPKCGKETDASGKYCQWCGADIESLPATPVSIPEEEDAPEVGMYAGLGRRFIAFIVDIILIILIGSVVITFFSLVNGVKYAYFMASGVPYSSLTEAGTLDAALAPLVAAIGMLFIVIPWLYFAGFESSRSQATPGKVLMRLIVTDLAGNKPTFARTTLRFFFKYISALIIFIGFIMIAFTKKRQGLHDKIAGCLVLLQD